MSAAQRGRRAREIPFFTRLAESIRRALAAAIGELRRKGRTK